MVGGESRTSGRRVRAAQRTTREDWIRTALDTLISDGNDSVKVSVLSTKLNCARSSSCWYFKDRRALLEALLDRWQSRITQAIVSRASWAADTVNMALVIVEPHGTRRCARTPEPEPARTSEETSDEQDWVSELLGILRSIAPDAFERLCQRIRRESGFTRVEVTGRAGDGGIDGAGVLRVT